MADLNRFREWSRALYELDGSDPERTSLYFDDVAVQQHDDIVAEKAEEFNDKTRLAEVLPDGWVVETLGTITSGSFEGSFGALLGTDVVIKPVRGTCGQRVQRLGGSNLATMLKEMPEVLAGEDWIVTRLYEQHPFFADVWPHSTNSMRFLTYIDLGGTARIAAVVQKWGTPESGFVDNFSKGGLTTWVHNGMLMGTMEDFSRLDQRDGSASDRPALVEGNASRWYYHPISLAPIAGKTVPFWAEAEEMALGATELMDSHLSYAGWDILITKDGPIIIEANPWPGVQIVQVHAPLLGDLRFCEFLTSQGVDF